MHKDIGELVWILEGAQCTMKKKNVLQLVLQFNFSIAMTTCNLVYFTLWMLSYKLHELQELQFIVYAIQLIVIKLQLYGNNLVSTSMQLHNYNHNIMLPLLIFIHPLKFDMWHYDDFWIILFLNIDLHCLVWLLMMVWNYDMWHNNFFATWHINWI